jgi:hypothetical protein
LLPDTSDEPFIATAHRAGATLVTGNERHYPAPQREGVAVVSPRQAIEQLRGMFHRGAAKPPEEAG